MLKVPIQTPSHSSLAGKGVAVIRGRRVLSGQTALRSSYQPEQKHKTCFAFGLKHRPGSYRMDRLEDERAALLVTNSLKSDTDEEIGVSSGGALPEAGGEPPGNDSKVPIDWVMTGLCFLFPAIGGALFGYDIGATSGALVSMTNPELSGTDWYNLSSLQSGMVVSASLLGALAGSATAFVVGDKLGRRREILLGAGLYGVGSLLCAASPSLGAILMARLVYGLGIGFTMHAAPAYIAETVPAPVRGLLISAKEAFIVGGILLGYVASYLFVDEVGGWRGMYGLAAAPAVALAAGMFWLPDSPRWLVLSKAGPDAASAALARARGRYGADKETVAREVSQMMAGVQQVQPTGFQEGISELFSPQNLRPLFIGNSLMLFQQITGQPSVLYYAARIFKDAGFAGAQEATGVSVILGIFKLLMTGLAVVTVDSWGRRPLLLAGVSGLTVALVALAGAQFGWSGGAGTWVSLLALLLYVGCYQVSFGPISWLIVGEVFPLSVRSQASALATLTNFGSNFLVSLTLPQVQDAIGFGATYSLFAVIGVGAVATIYSFVPETKGKTLEEIEALWEDHSE